MSRRSFRSKEKPASEPMPPSKNFMASSLMAILAALAMTERDRMAVTTASFMLASGSR